MPRERWSNWVGDRNCVCDVIMPSTPEDLCREVASRAGAGRIRAAGNSYSWAPLIPNPGTIVRMERLDKLIELDKEKKTVEIEVGMSVEDLTAICARAGLALISPTLFPYPQIGGALATGSHGTGFGVSTLADSVIEMKIVKRDGSIETVDDTSADFAAAKVALGSLGIIYSVKLQLVEDYRIFTDKVLVPVEAVLDGFEDLLTTAQYLEMFWFPFQKQFWVYLMDETDSSPDAKTWFGDLRQRVSTWVQDTGGNVLTPWIARYLPRLTPFLNKMAIRMSDQVGPTISCASEAFHFQKAYPKNWDMSYSVPAEYTRRAWSEAIGLVEEFGNQGLYPVNLALHCRFTAASTTWLAADHGRETCFIEVATAKGTPHWHEFYRQMEDRWFAIPGSRPHWAKVYDTARQIKGRYERMDDFLAVREKWDPDRVFLNDFLENEIFQLNGA